jgi:23S rRNA (uracil1939-C5)-methyltransferase
LEAEPGQWAVFSELAAPGDVAEVEVARVVKRYVEADMIELIEGSPDRVKPPCPYFGQCGGCNWQHFSYQGQLVEKAEIFKYILTRNGLGRGLEVACQPCALPFHYRTRADLTFSRQGGRLIGGFLRRKSHNLLDVKECMLLTEPLCQGVDRLKRALFPLVSEIPEDRSFKVRALQDPGSGRIFVQPLKGDLLLRDFMETYELIDEKLVAADKTICSFEVDGLQLQFDPYCFTQVNMVTNELLVHEAMKALELNSGDRVLELYAGIGNFTYPIAKRAKKVLAVEVAGDSARFSVINGKQTGYSNVVHHEADSEKACRRLAKKGRRFDKVLVDPPRSGMGPSAVNALCSLEPDRIVSVSCHPDTLAKDLKGFTFRGYEIESIACYDMFPQTFHMETLTTLRRH